MAIEVYRPSRPTGGSDFFSTGQALYALGEAIDKWRERRKDEKLDEAKDKLLGPAIRELNRLSQQRLKGDITADEADEQARILYDVFEKRAKEEGFDEREVSQVVDPLRAQFVERRRAVEGEFRARTTFREQQAARRAAAEKAKREEEAARRKAERKRFLEERTAHEYQRLDPSAPPADSVRRAQVVSGFRREADDYEAQIRMSGQEPSPEEVAQQYSGLKDRWTEEGRTARLADPQMRKLRDEMDMASEVAELRAGRSYAEAAQLEADLELARQGTDRTKALMDAGDAAAPGGQAGARILDDLDKAFGYFEDSPLGFSFEDRVNVLTSVLDKRMRYALSAEGAGLTTLRRRWERGADPILNHKVFEDLPDEMGKQLIERAMDDALDSVQAVAKAEEQFRDEMKARREEKSYLQRLGVAQQLGEGSSLSDVLYQLTLEGTDGDTVKLAGELADVFRKGYEDRSTDPIALWHVSRALEGIRQQEGPALNKWQTWANEALVSRIIDRNQWQEVTDAVNAARVELPNVAKRDVQKYFTNTFIDVIDPYRAGTGAQNPYMASLSQPSQRLFHNLAAHMEGRLIQDGRFEVGSGEHMIAITLMKAGHAVLTMRDQLGNFPGLPGQLENPMGVFEDALDFIITRGNQLEGGSLDMDDQALFWNTQIFGDTGRKYFAYENGDYDVRGTGERFQTDMAAQGLNPATQELHLQMILLANDLSKAIKALPPGKLEVLRPEGP